MAAIFVQLSENDPALDAAQLLVNIKHGSNAEAKEKELTELGQLVAGHKYEQLLERILFQSADAVLNADAPDINTIVNLSFSLLQNLSAGDAASKFVQQFAELLTRDARHPLLKLKLLTILFNLTDVASLRYTVFEGIVRYALTTHNGRVLADQLPSVEKWIKDWKLSNDQSANLYLALTRLAESVDDRVEHKRLLYKYFHALEAASAAVQAAGREEVAKAAVAAIQSPNVKDCDELTRFHAVRQLEADPQHAGTFALLRIAAHGTIADFEAFRSKHADHLAKLGLDAAATSQRMRSLTLCSLGQQRREHTFAELEKALMVQGAEEVERCVVEAVMADLVEAKIDQAEQTVLIQRSTSRTFNEDAWRELLRRLRTWETHSREMLNALVEIRAAKA